MASKNVETVRSAVECWNHRDFEGSVRNVAEGITYTDYARNITVHNRNQFRQWSEGWVQAFSDAQIKNPKYTDAGDVVIAEFTGEGTNDGPFGGLPPTGKRMSSRFCEIYRFDPQGRIVSGGIYYDQYALLVQLGHLQPLAAAA